MMTEQKTYYDILGVPRTATDEEIKKSYRQLVRQHHPDVAKDKEAAKALFIQIAEAYKTLINPDKRLIYDTSIDTQRFRPQPSARPGASRSQESGRATGPVSGASTGQQRNAQARVQTQNAYTSRRTEVERWLKEARKAFGAGQFRSAMYACKEARRLDPRNAEAHIILGDVYRIQGRTEEAIAMYTIAVQLDPRNIDVQTKLDRLFRKTSVPTAEAPEEEERRASLKVGVNFIAAAIIGGLLLWLNLRQGQPILWLKEHFSFVDTWSANLLIVLGVSSLLTGIMLSLNGWVRHMDDELIFPSVKASGMKSVSYPVGLILVILSLFSFYISMAVYLIIGWLQECMSVSIWRVFGGTVALTLLAAVAFSNGGAQVLLFGSNIAFLSILVGWGIGDIFRDDW